MSLTSVTVTLRSTTWGYHVYINSRLFFSQPVFLCEVMAGYPLFDFFFFYVFKVLYMFGLTTLKGKKRI